MSGKYEAAVALSVTAGISIPKVAVLMCTHNGSEWIREQLNSILMQEGVQVDLFISDDHSTDETIHVISEYIEEANIHIALSSPLKKRGSAASNFFHLFSLYDCHGYDYIALSDQDDIWFSGKLERAHKSLAIHAAAAYSSDFVAFWPNGRRKHYRKSQPQRGYDYIFEGGGPGCSYVMTAKFYGYLRLWVLNNQKLISKIWMHDWFIYALARASGEAWFIDKFCSFMYRQHSNNTIGVNDGWLGTISRLRLINRGLYREQVMLFAQILPKIKRDWARALGFGWAGNFYIIRNIRETRRNFWDRFFLLILCIFNIF